jgi:tetratricopeptide (TPR) repeat protein
MTAGLTFMTMDFIDGRDTAALLREQQKFSPKIAAELIAKTCQALAAAHAEGVIHRDLKPQNMMVNQQGELVLMDFGVARSLIEDGGMAHAGTMLGTPTYMSPEQAKGEQVDTRSYIYSLGIIFYEFLTGKVPFDGDTALGTLLKRIEGPPPSPAKLERTVPAPLSEIVLKCLQPDAAKRYQTAEEMQLDLEAWLGQESGIPVMAAPAPSQRGWYHRRNAFAVVLGIALLATGLAFLSKIRKPPALPKTVTVLVADFDNKTGDPVFDRTLEPVLGTALERSSFISSFSRVEAQKTGAQVQPGATKLDRNLAGLVAARQGIDVVVAGSIQSKGDGYVVSLSATEAASGNQIISRQSVVASKERVLAEVDNLAAPVSKALGDAFHDSTVPAAHQYALGQEFQYAAKWDDAIRAYSRAIELDPTLGRAYFGLAVVYFNLRQRQRADSYFRKAMSMADVLTARERYRTRASYFLSVGDLSNAIKELSQLVAHYPADSGGLNNLALAYSYGREMGKAVEYERKSVAISPKSAVRRFNVAAFSMYAGDFATAESEAQATIQLNADYVKTYVVLALSQLAGGKAKEAADTYKRLESVTSLGPDWASIGLADLALYQGRLADAVGVLVSGIMRSRADHNATLAAKELLMLAAAPLMTGQKPGALKAADEALAEYQQDEVAVEAARIFVQAGNDVKARALAAQLNTKLNRDFQAYAKVIEGEILREHGDAPGAIQAFRQAQTLADTWLGRFDLGRAYLAAGAAVLAHSEFSVCQSRRGEATALFLDEIPTYHYFPGTLYYLARVQEQLKSPTAAEAYRAFLALKSPESAEPMVVAVHRSLGKL